MLSKHEEEARRPRKQLREERMLDHFFDYNSQTEGIRERIVSALSNVYVSGLQQPQRCSNKYTFYSQIILENQ